MQIYDEFPNPANFHNPLVGEGNGKTYNGSHRVDGSPTMTAEMCGLLFFGKMISTRPNIDTDGLYTPVQAAKALEVDRHTIRRYELRGYLLFKTRKFDNRRVVSGRHLIRLWASVR